MIIYENGFKLMPYVARFTQNGEQKEQAVADKALLGYETMGHIANLSFEEVEYTQEQRSRLDEVADYPEIDFQAVNEYVLEGTLHEGSALANMKHAQGIQATLDMLVFDGLGGF